MADTERARRRRVGLTLSLLGLLLLVVVPLLVAQAVNVVYERDHAVDDSQARTTEVVSTGAASIRQLVDRTGVLLATVGRTTDPSGDRCSAELAAALVPDAGYRNLWAVDGDGRVLCTAVGEPLTDDVSGTEWFAAVDERDDLTLTAPALGLANDKPVMAVAAPVGPTVDPDEVATGRPPTKSVLATSLELWSMLTFTGAFDLSPDSVVEVLDGDGRMLARRPGLTSELLRVVPYSAELSATSGTFSGPDVDGVDRLWSYQRVEVAGQELTVVAGITRSEAYAKADRDLVWSLGVIVGLGLVVGLVATVGARRLVIAPTRRLRDAMAGFRAGDVDRRAGEIGGAAELSELGETFDGMAAEIERRLHDQERLLLQLEEASEAERQSIAAGIHDETVQNLGAIRIRLQLLRRALETEQSREGIDAVVSLLDETTAQLRGLLFDLRPAEFDRLGLLATLRETVEVRLGTELEGWTVTGDVGPEVPEAVQILLYRVAVQALANVRQHADADRVEVDVSSTPSMVTMVVVDDGRGFDPEVVERQDRPGHIGLRVMRDRVRAVGGEVTIDSSPGRGTTVTAVVPLPGAEPIPAGGTDDRGGS